MHTEDPAILAELRLSLFSAVGDGMHLEVSAPSAASGLAGPFMTFREDESLGKQVVLHTAGGDVAFPMSELKWAIAVAEEDVHKESFYD